MNKHVSTRQPGIEDSEPMFAPQPDKKFKKSDQFKEHDEALEVRIRTETNLPEWYVLDDLIENHHPLPQGSMILGVDPDGKPLVLSLEDSSFGSMLFLGDDEAFNRKHLMSVLSSAESLNPPDLLQIDVISPNPAGFQTEKSQVRKICDVSDDCAFTILGDLLSEIEDRIREHRQLPFQIIVIDQIELLVARLAEESLRYLRWILRRGPQAGIWPMATLSSDQLPQFDLKTYKSFGFHLYGKMTSVDSINKFCRVSPKVLMSLSPGSQGCFLIESDLISFSIPEIAH